MTLVSNSVYNVQLLVSDCLLMLSNTAIDLTIIDPKQIFKHLERLLVIPDIIIF